MKTTFSIVCFRSKTLANGEHPLVLQMFKDGKRSCKSLGISVNPQHWDFSKNRPKNNCPNREHILKIILNKEKEIQNRLLEMEAEQKAYTPTSMLHSQKKDFQEKTVKDFYKSLIKDFENAGKVGNRLIYKASYNSLKEFTKDRLNIPFSDIDAEFLAKYEEWQRDKGNKETTISLTFRTLRSAYNKAISNKCARKCDYPFDDYKISKFNTRTPKRAIGKDDVLKFTGKVKPIGKREFVNESKDIFIFSYLCGGINFTDIANLTEKNIVDGRLHYIRQKTGKEIRIGIPAGAMQIIRKYRKQRKGYLFPILDEKTHITPLQKQNRIHKILGKVNRNLKEIAAQLGVKGNISTYVARHSFATILKKSGVSIAIISEALGHSDLATTQIYLDSFDNEQIDEAMKNLL